MQALFFENVRLWRAFSTWDLHKNLDFYQGAKARGHATDLPSNFIFTVA